MVLSLLLIGAVAVLALSLGIVQRSAREEERGSRRQLEALYLCEAGLHRATADLAAGGTGEVGSQLVPLELGSGTFFVTATDLGDGRTSLIATGTDQGARMSVEVVVRETPSGFFQWGAFGDEGVTLDSNAMVDSYDSSLGVYEDQDVNGNGSDRYARSNGDVGSNSSVGLRSNSGIHGDAIPGPSGSTSIVGNAFVTGTTAPATELQTLPSLTVPSFTDLGPLYVGSGTHTLSAGNYAYGATEVNGTAELVIEGPATLVLDSLTLDSNSELWVDATNGPVEIYVINDFVMNSNTTVASRDFVPANLTLNLLSDNVIDPGIDIDLDAVDFDSNAKLYGTIFAPHALVEIDSNFELFGALIARRVHLDSNSKIHYDEALASAGAAAGAASLETLCWRVLGGS